MGAFFIILIFFFKLYFTVVQQPASVYGSRWYGRAPESGAPQHVDGGQHEWANTITDLHTDSGGAI